MEPAAIRFKNPGAMWPGKIATKWGSKKTVLLNDGQGNKIAVFDNWVDGICAQLDLWRTSPNYRNQKFSNAIAVWSGHNNVESYIRYVLARVPGMTRDTVMNDAFWSGPMAIPFLKAQSGHEAGREIPAPDADWIEAQRRVFLVGKVKTVVVTTTAATTTAATAAATAGHPGSVIVFIIIVGAALLAGGLWFFLRKKKENT